MVYSVSGLIIQESQPNTPSKALVYATESMFPNIHHVLRVMCTVPVTSCECERSISVLRRLKTYLHAFINGSGTVFWTGLNAHSLQHGTQFRRDR